METNMIIALILLSVAVVGIALPIYFCYTPDNCGPICVAKSKKFRFMKFYNEKDNPVFCIQFKYHLIWHTYLKWTYCPETYKTLEDAKEALEKIIMDGQTRMEAKKRKVEYFE